MWVGGPDVVINQNRQGRRLPDLGTDTGLCLGLPSFLLSGHFCLLLGAHPYPGLWGPPPTTSCVGGKTVSWPPLPAVAQEMAPPKGRAPDPSSRHRCGLEGIVAGVLGHV